MIIHRTCGGSNVRLLIEVKLSLDFGLTPKGVKPNMGDIQYPPSGEITPKWFCLSCSREVVLDDLSTHCGYCGEVLPVSECVRPSRSGGYYCKMCGEKFRDNGETLNSVSKLMSKLVLGKE